MTKVEIVVVALLLTPCLGVAPAKGAIWGGSGIEYKINVSSFAALDGVAGYSQQQIERIVAHASGTWISMTGIDLPVIYGGTTTLGWAEDDISIVSAKNGYCNVDPSYIGYVQPYYNGSGNIIEADLRIYAYASGFSGKVPYEVRPSAMAGKIDLQGTLVHEWSHVLGGADDACDGDGNAHVTSHNMSVAGTIANRIPDQCDREYIAGLGYNAKSMALKLRRYSNVTATWETSTSTIGAADFPAGASGAVGRASNGDSIVVVAANKGDGLRWYEASYPLSTNPTWTVRSASGGTYPTSSTPAIAARDLAPTSQLWVTAWAARYTSLSACGIRFMVSSDAFQTYSRVWYFSTACTATSPVVTYDRASDRFVLMYHVLDRTNSGNSGRIAVWTYRHLQSTPWHFSGLLNRSGSIVYSPDTPGISCEETGGQCMVNYIRGSTVDPTFVSGWFSINTSTGAVTLETGWTSSNFSMQWSPAALTSTGTAWKYWAQMNYPVGMSQWAEGWGYAYTSTDTVVPLSSYSWASSYARSGYPISLVGGAARDNIYQISVQ